MTSLFKLFYSTDWHAKERNPDTRIDQFSVAIERKVRTYFQMGADMGCDAYGVGGDFVDVFYLGSKYVIRLGDIVQEELDKTGKKLYYILGNHDIDAYNPNSITRTAFGVFLHFNTNMIRLGREPLPVTTPNGKTILLSGVHSYSQLDKPIYGADGETVIAPRYRDWVVEETREPRIHMVHGFLTPVPILDTIPHSLISEMRHTRATVTLGAHDHTGFAVTPIDHGLAYNPGALGRVFASYAEMNRMPKYCMVTIYDDGTPEIQPIQCPVAEPGDQVMDRTKLNEKKAREALLVQTKERVQEVFDVNVGPIELHAIMARYKSKVRPEVFREVERRLQKEESHA